MKVWARRHPAVVASHISKTRRCGAPASFYFATWLTSRTAPRLALVVMAA